MLPIAETWGIGALISIAPIALPEVLVAAAVAGAVLFLDKAPIIEKKSVNEWLAEKFSDGITNESGKKAYQDGYGPSVEN